MSELSQRQKDLILQGWDVLAADMRATGTALFTEIFTRYPAYQKKFRVMKDMPLEEAVKSTRMKGHAVIFMRALQNVILNMDEPDVMADVLETIARRHAELGFRKVDFEKVFDILHDILKDHEAVTCTDHPQEARDAWRVATDAMLEVIGNVTVTYD